MPAKKTAPSEASSKVESHGDDKSVSSDQSSTGLEHLGLTVEDVLKTAPEGREIIKTRDEQPEEEDQTDSESSDEHEDEETESESETQETDSEEETATDEETDEETEGDDQTEETTSEGDEETQEEESKDDEGLTDEEKKQAPPWVLKRIGKMTAQKKELKTRAETAEAKLQEVQPEVDRLKGELEKVQSGSVKLNPTPDDPLSDLNSEDEVNQTMEHWRKMKRWAAENWDGGQLPDKDGKMHDIDAKEVRANSAFADEMLNYHVPRRLQYITIKKQADMEAKRDYPKLYDSKSEDYQFLQNIKRVYPELLRKPNHMVIIGDAIAGMRLRKAKWMKKPGEKTTTLPKLPGKGGLPKPPNTKTLPKVSAVKKKQEESSKNLSESASNPKKQDDWVMNNVL